MGINLMLKYALMCDTRWDVKNYNFNDLISKLSNNDKSIINDLNFIGDGELNGLAMGTFATKMFLKAQDNEIQKKLMSDWANILMYTQFGIVYDEFRHGVIIKELYYLINNNISWKENIQNTESIKYFIGEDIWENEYELLVSLFLGEITNEALYGSISNFIENDELKSIIKNIEKDEARHKSAWFELTKELLESNPEHKKRYITAFKKVHAIHQAEVGENFTKGIRYTQKYLVNEVTSKIEKSRFNYMSKLLGSDMPLTQQEMTRAHMMHNFELVKNKRNINEI